MKKYFTVFVTFNQRYTLINTKSTLLKQKPPELFSEGFIMILVIAKF